MDCKKFKVSSRCIHDYTAHCGVRTLVTRRQHRAEMHNTQRSCKMHTFIYFFAEHKEHMHVSILMLSVMSRAPFVFRIRCVMGFVYRNIDASFVSPSTMLCIV